MARIPDSELERLKKEVPLERLVIGFGVELKRHGAEIDALAGHLAEDESVALPGRMQCGRLEHRLGDEDQGSELPACCRVAPGRSSLHRDGECRTFLDGGI